MMVAGGGNSSSLSLEAALEFVRNKDALQQVLADYRTEADKAEVALEAARIEQTKASEMSAKAAADTKQAETFMDEAEAFVAAQKADFEASKKRAEEELAQVAAAQETEAKRLEDLAATLSTKAKDLQDREARASEILANAASERDVVVKLKTELEAALVAAKARETDAAGKIERLNVALRGG